jgi:hypothetical protein
MRGISMVRLRPGAALLGLASIALMLGSACTQQGGDNSATDEESATTVAAAATADFGRIGDKPDLNGLWQVNNSANWNLEAHSAADLPQFPELGAIAAIPAGISYVEGGKIPYLPEARPKRDEFRASWPAEDPEANCYMPGIPRATYMPYPFQIVQGNRDILFAYEFATANRTVNMVEHQDAVVPTWMGTSNGHWEGDTLVVEVTGNNDQAWYDRAGNYRGASTKVTERYTKISDDRIDYEATIEDPSLYSRPWTIRMPIYRRAEPNAQMLEFKCVPFAEEKIYGYLTKGAGEQSE